jgi:hypothetical protein
VQEFGAISGVALRVALPELNVQVLPAGRNQSGALKDGNAPRPHGALGLGDLQPRHGLELRQAPGAGAKPLVARTSATPGSADAAASAPPS